MKSEMIAFSPAGLIALVGAVVTLCIAVAGDWPFLFVSCALLAIVRDDMREGFRAGRWKRGWFMWTWEGPNQ